MSTLTQAAIFSKKASVWAVVGIIAIIVLFVFFGIGKSIIKALFPTPPPPPTVAFGKLPKMILTDGIAPNPGVEYNLQTITGDFPQLPDKAKVFGIGEPDSSFGTLDRVKDKVLSRQFENPVEVSSGVLKFTDANNSERTLTADTSNFDFLLESNYSSNPKILASSPKTLEDSIARAGEFLQGIGVEMLDFDEEKITIEFLRIDGSVLSSANSISSANLVEVIYNRSDLDGIPVIWPNEAKPGFYALVSQDQVVEAKYQTQPIQKHRFATYPLKGPAAAFEELKRGNGAFNKPLAVSQVAIIDVTLGYVESSKNNEFLAPVYFFKGTGDFLAYVPAVSNNWIK